MQRQLQDMNTRLAQHSGNIAELARQIARLVDILEKQTLNAAHLPNEADSPIHSAFCECKYFWPDPGSTVGLCGSCGKPLRS